MKTAQNLDEINLVSGIKKFSIPNIIKLHRIIEALWSGHPINMANLVEQALCWYILVCNLYLASHSSYRRVTMLTLKLSLVILMANFCEPLTLSFTLQPPRGITPYTYEREKTHKFKCLYLFRNSSSPSPPPLSLPLSLSLSLSLSLPISPPSLPSF